MRTRSLIHVLSLELFGISLPLPSFPRVKSLRGIGLSDPAQYANLLSVKFDYRNTFYDREPRFDIGRPDEEDFDKYDFLIASEVFEHVPPPAEVPFQNAFRVLRQAGVLVLTVPYSLDPATAEHFPGLHEHGMAQVGGRTVLVNRRPDGRLETFENLVFHYGCGEPSLEMREFSENGLKTLLAGAGFNAVHIYSEDHPVYGIVHSGAWSLPISARKGDFAFSPDATRDVLREWRDLNVKFHGEMKRLDRALWFRIGRKLGLIR